MRGTPGPAPPGSVLWLLRYELLLQWRRWGRGKALSGALLVAVLLGAQAGGLGAAWMARSAAAGLPDRITLANAALLGAGLLMLSQAFDAALAALFERRDLDWLLASPLPFRRVLAARLLGVAASVAGPCLLLGGAAANGMALLGEPGWLAAYPVLGALALGAASAGTAGAVGLAAGIGLRRARRVLGAVGMVLSGLAFLGSQSAALLPPGLRAAAWEALSPACCGVPSGAGWWPARALLGEPGPLLAVVLLGLGMAGTASWGLERRFTRGAAVAEPSRAPRGAGQGAGGRFRRGTAGALLRKELRLLRRTPGLLGRAAYPLVYAVPAAAGLWQGSGAAAFWLGTASVFVAGSVARVLISAAAGADEAAELAASAPVRPGAVRAAKMAVAGLGAVAMMALPVAAASWQQPGLTGPLLGGVVGVVASGLLLGVWRPAPARRTDLGASRAGSTGAALLGAVIDGAWSGAAALTMRGNAWAALPAGLAAVMLACARPRRR